MREILVLLPSFIVMVVFVYCLQAVMKRPQQWRAFGRKRLAAIYVVMAVSMIAFVSLMAYITTHVQVGR